MWVIDSEAVYFFKKYLFSSQKTFSTVLQIGRNSLLCHGLAPQKIQMCYSVLTKMSTAKLRLEKKTKN